MNPKVDRYIQRSGDWQQELEMLRPILLDTPMIEEFKWGAPCYTLDGKNVVLMHIFKEYCALLFVKGALLEDPEEVLVQQTENTQSARQIRFASVEEITEMHDILKSYIHQAIEVEKAGLRVEFKKTEEYDVPEEFQSELDADPELKSAFESLTPGRQRGYLLHFSGAKQSATRTSRVQKCIPMIMEGKGLNDRS